MPDTIYGEAPPEGCEQHGWVCVYHRGACHNSLDCDLVPLWRKADEHRDQRWRKRWSEMSPAERDDVIARAV